MQGGYDSIGTKVADGDGLNAALEARARAVGLESRGEREGGKPRTGASGTKQGGATANAIRGCEQGTVHNGVSPAQQQQGGSQGLIGRGTREDAPGLDPPGLGEKEELVELVRQKPLQSHARAAGARVWLQAQEKVCIRKKESSLKPRTNEMEQGGTKTVQQAR